MPGGGWRAGKRPRKTTSPFSTSKPRWRRFLPSASPCSSTFVVNLRVAYFRQSGRANGYCIDDGSDPAAIVGRWRQEYARNDAYTLYRAVGCDYCSHTGYQGRLGLHELLSVAPVIKRMIQTRAPISELLPAAFAGGMRTLKQDGLVKVLQGRTDVAQVRAVCV